MSRQRSKQVASWRRQACYVHSGLNVYRCGLYLEGLRRVFGKVKYTTQGFPQVPRDALLFRTEAGRRFVIDTQDSAATYPQALSWSTRYGKVNVAPGPVRGGGAGKVVPVGPTFPVRLWKLPAALAQAGWTYVHGAHENASLRAHVRPYVYQARHEPLRAYVPRPSQGDYVFSCFSIWRDEARTNALRARFIRACRTLPDIRFEGGFRPRTHNDVPGFEALTLPHGYTHEAYAARTAASAVCFNVPAVLSCHSFRLGEYLAFGKAIISTPLERAMPSPLVHGEHIHYVDGTEASIQEAVRRLCTDHAYRERLEQGARRYYEAFLEPAGTVRRLVRGASRPVPAESALEVLAGA